MTHPEPASLLLEPLPADVAEHLAQCPRCRIDRRMLLSASVTSMDRGNESGAPARTWIEDLRAVRSVASWDGPARIGEQGPVVRSGEDEMVILGQFVDLDRIRARFDACEAAAVPGVDRWTTLEQVDGVWVAIWRPAGSVSGVDALIDEPSALARWLRQAVAALARLHAVGLAHGGLAEEPARVTTDGRAFLPPPILVGEGEFESDWRALGEVFQTWLDIVPAAGFREVADDMAAGALRGVDVVIRVLELSIGDHNDTRYEDLGLLGTGGNGRSAKGA